MDMLRLEDTGEEEAARQAAKALAEGGLVLYPTDTLYAIGADATNPEAVARLRELKGRDAKKPISVAVRSVEEMSRYGEMNAAARSLAERFLPGALTLVVPATRRIPGDIQLDGSIGIRVPDDGFARALVRAFDRPVTATSANRSGLETPPTVEGVIAQLGPLASGIALAIDGGARAGALPSTVVSCVGDAPYVLREGRITREELDL